MHVIFTNKDWYFRDILLRWSSIVTKWSHRIYLYWSPKRTELLKNQWFSNSGCPTDNKQHQVVGATFNSHSSFLGVMKWSPGPVPVLEQLDKPKQQSHSYVYNIYIYSYMFTVAMSELNDSKSWKKEGKRKVLHIISTGLVKDVWLFLCWRK